MSLTRFYDVLLGEGLLASLHQHALGPYTLAWCGARLAQAPSSSAVEFALVPAAAGSEGEDVFMEEAAAGTDHGGIFIGDVKLSEVKEALANSGIASEFRSGALVCCGGIVRVIRADGEEGHLVMEGPLSEEYFKVRDVVYGQYNVC
jgi:cleavage and polyadenylation specificity factor subunit 2